MIMLKTNFAQFESTLKELNKGMQHMQAEVNTIKQKINLDKDI